MIQDEYGQNPDLYVTDGNKWMSKEEYDKWSKFKEDFDNRFFKALLWGIVDKEELTPEQEYENNLKWAYVNIDNQRVMLFINNKDMKAYKTEGYEVIKPLKEVKYTSFERWCTTFDL